MASYENLMTEQPWSFRPAISDAWFSDLYTRETETITKALQSSMAGASSNVDFFQVGVLESLFFKPDTTSVQTPTVSGVSENESPVAKQGRSVPPRGRVAKRKSRASKRTATTTFIATDPENFMRMVQQVTGVRLSGCFNEQLPAPPMPHSAAGNRLTTLDTSAFILDSAASCLVSQPSTTVAEGGARTSEHYFDSSCSFPTLESSKAVDYQQF